MNLDEEIEIIIIEPLKEPVPSIDEPLEEPITKEEPILVPKE